MRLDCVLASAAVALAASFAVTDAWIAPIVMKGNKFFNSETGEEFRMKGMAYYPRPNGGEMANVGNYDWAADDYEHVWRPHLEIMKELGVNTIRLYSVDPTRSHDKFMCACSEAGIYVLIGMTAPCLNCSVQDAKPPACYPGELFTRIQMVYNAMAVYDNTLGFSVGNENNLQIKYGKDGTTTAPCVKALLRDTRAYADSCSGSLRKVPIGLDIADIPPREQWIQYYDCEIDGNEFTRADWQGFNPYVECDPLQNKEYADSEGLQSLMKAYEKVGYARPMMFGEYGCNEGENTIDGYENQRGFYDAKWMNEEPEMTAQIVGGNVFEFTTEIANLVNEKVLSKEKDPGKYGIGYFQPDDCDHDKIPCEFVPYPEFDNLKKAYLTTKNSTVTYDSFKPTRSDKALSCPAKVSQDLPVTPRVEQLACSAIRPKCGGTSARSPSQLKRASDENRAAADDSTDSTNDATKEGSGSPLTNGASTAGVQVAVAAAMALAAFMA